MIISSHDAKSRLPELLRRVEAGETFTITNRGKPVADLTLSGSTARAKASIAIANILKARKRTASDADIAELKEKGRG